MMHINTKYLLASGLLLLGGIAMAGVTVVRSAAFGRLPDPSENENYQKSPNFNATKGIFINRRQAAIDVRLRSKPDANTA